MTSHPVTEPKRSVYDTCDPHYLRQLRERAGVDLFALARTACLSVAQVKQLETEGSDGLFYSDAIKRQAYKRLLMILGAEPPTVEIPDALCDPVKVAEAHVNTLDHIVAMSRQPAMNRSAADVLAELQTQLYAHWRVVSALVLFVAMAMALSVYQRTSVPESATVVPASKASMPAQSNASAVAEAQSQGQAASSQLPQMQASGAVSTPSAPAASVPAPIASAPASVASAPNAVVATRVAPACAYVTEAMPELTPFTAHKEGRYVYLVSPVDADICVVDGKQQVTSLQLKAGESRTVNGSAPWQISAAQLSKVQVFFQGGRVTLPEAAQRVRLVEVPVNR